MIDPRSETLVPLRDVPKLRWMPYTRRGKGIHIATIYRWATRGRSGPVLETVRVPGVGRCTSEDALVRFFSRISEDPSALQIDSAREEETDRRTLRDAGIE